MISALQHADLALMQRSGPNRVLKSARGPDASFCNGMQRRKGYYHIIALPRLFCLNLSHSQQLK
jgi:hypothetical protein